MTQSQLSALLESITGHIETASPEQERILQNAQEQIAASLLVNDDTGAEQLFTNSDFYSREKINTASLDKIATIAAKTVQQNTGNGLRAAVRSVPVRNAQVAGSIPDW